jgi:hypothetical protein
MTDKLTTVEAAQLQRHEAVIKAGKNAWMAVGHSLSAIKEARLYREDYNSWDEYLKLKWGWSRQRFAQVEGSRTVLKELPEKLATSVDNERAARELGKVPKEKRESVLEKAVKGSPTGKATTKAIRKAAKVEVEASIEDTDGVQVPTELVPLWLRGSEMAEVLHGISKIKSILRAAQEQDDPLWRQVMIPTVLADLSKAWTSIQQSKPYAVCPQCQGHPEVSKCRLCKQTGFIGKLRYSAVDKDLLDVRKKAMVKK